MTVGKLKEVVKLTFRQSYINDNKKPYLGGSNNSSLFKYISDLSKLGVECDYGDNYVQRKLQLDRLNSISKYISDSNNIIPNSIVLACYNMGVESKYTGNDYIDFINPIDEKLGLYSIDITNEYVMTVIDGQHRLAGYFCNNNSETDEIELPIVLLFGPSISMVSKIFIDINGNQKSVDKSLIYDLTGLLEDVFDENKLKDKEIRAIKECHNIIRSLYEEESSPIYDSVKMLGTGDGFISQAFLVECIYPIIYKGVLSKYQTQEKLNALYTYLKAIQHVFQEDWPIIEDCQNIEQQKNYRYLVISIKKSQLPKTLGLSAMFNNFEYHFKKCEFNYKKYIDSLYVLKDNIVWNRLEYDRLKTENKLGSKIYVEGTNKAAIQNLTNQIRDVLVKNFY
jgi:DGQHR domain-containing protein